MAFPWLVLLQSVPWGEVIKNAPKVAEGAKKLWGSVRKKEEVADASSRSALTQSASHQSIEALQTRLEKLEADVVDLHQQMLASSELIKTLAEQNAQLVERVEANRRRVIALAVALCVFSVLAFVV